MTTNHYWTGDPDGRTVGRGAEVIGFADTGAVAGAFVAALRAYDPDAAPGPVRYRTGRSLGRTVYRQGGVEASKADVLLGVMDTRVDGALVAAALNQHPPQGGAAGPVDNDGVDQ